MIRLLSLSFVLVISALSVPAQAASVDPVDYFRYGSSVGMGNVEIGQHGTIVTGGGNTSYTPYGGGLYYIGTAYGYMPKQSKITFSYTMDLSIDNPAAFLNAVTQYDGEIDGKKYSSTSSVNDYYQPQIPSTGSQDVYGLVLTAASFPDDHHATLVFSNNSNAWAYFYGLLSTGVAGSGYVKYRVDAVPLPAALPLFGAGLLGLAGVKKRLSTRKKSQEAESA